MKAMALCCVAAVALGCGSNKEQSGDGATARGKGYEIPVPAGFEIATAKEFEPLISAGGAVLARTAGGGDAFLGSIVVAPVPGDPGGDLADEAFCKKIAAEGATGLRTELLSANVIGAPGGKTCQWVTRGEDAGKVHQATGTVLRAGELLYVVTCNYDPGDTAAQKGCDQVVAGWKDTAASPGP